MRFNVTDFTPGWERRPRSFIYLSIRGWDGSRQNCGGSVMVGDAADQPIRLFSFLLHRYEKKRRIVFSPSLLTGYLLLATTRSPTPIGRLVHWCWRG